MGTIETAPKTRAKNAPAERPPSLPSALTAPVKGAFKLASSLRPGRSLHPQGIAARAKLTGLADPEMSGVSLLVREEEHLATVRFSRAVGLPRRVPDFLGFAFRVPDAYGEGRHQDLLLVSSLPFPGGRHTLFPGVQGFAGALYSSLLAYDLGGNTRLLGVRSARPRRSTWELEGWREQVPGTEWELCAATVTGPWKPVARIEIEHVLPDEVSESIELSPWNTGGGIRPVGPYQGIRAPAYEGSHEGRHPHRR